MWSVFVLALGARWALGAEPVGVLYAGDPVEAAEAAAAATRGDTRSFDPVRLPGVRDGAGPRVLGGLPGAGCVGAATTNSTVRERVSRGEALYNNAEFERALVEAKAAVAGVACLSEAAEASLAARAWVLLGVVHLEVKDEAAARAAFRSATLFQPGGVTFDSRFRASHRAVLESVSAEVASAAPAKLRIGPGGAGGLWVDGRAPTVAGNEVALPPGQHLIQVLLPTVSSVVIEARSGDVLDLVRPAAYTDADVALAADPAWQPWFGAALAGTGVEYVWSDGKLWKIGDNWEAMTPRIRGASAGDKWAGLLTGTGVSTVALGATALGLGYQRIAANTASPNGETREQEELRLRAYGSGEAMVMGGWVASGLGVAALVPGVVLAVKHW